MRSLAECEKGNVMEGKEKSSLVGELVREGERKWNLVEWKMGKKICK